MQSEGEDGSLAVDYFTFSSSIADHLRSASLVISHAGNRLFSLIFPGYIRACRGYAQVFNTMQFFPMAMIYCLIEFGKSC